MYLLMHSNISLDTYLYSLRTRQVTHFIPRALTGNCVT